MNYLNAIILRLNEALLGAITSQVRAISIAWRESKQLTIRVYTDSKPSEETRYQIEVAATHVTGDLPFITWCEEEFIHLDTELNEGHNIGFWVYRRFEPDE